MPPKIYSRHLYTAGVTVADREKTLPCGKRVATNPDHIGKLWLTNRVPFRYRNVSDNLTHIVADGDTLWGLAARYYNGLPRPDGLWWIIADYQPDPIFDPTIQLAAGQHMIIPSMRTVVEDIFNERRRSLGVGIA